jgi:hypothetical protein
MSGKVYALHALRLEDETGPYLEFLKRSFPREMRRALRSLGFWMRGEMRAAIWSGGSSIGESWPERADATRSRRLTLLKAGKYSERRGRWTRSKKLNLVRGERLDLSTGRKGRPLGPEPFGNKLAAAVRYKLQPEFDRVQIGFLSPLAIRFAEAVQEGRRGARRNMTYTETQPMGENMRRMFWAAGIPLARGRRTLRQEKRPLVEPLFRRRQAEINRRLSARVEAYLRGLDKEAASAYVRTALDRGGEGL